MTAWSSEWRAAQRPELIIKLSGGLSPLIDPNSYPEGSYLNAVLHAVLYSALNSVLHSAPYLPGFKPSTAAFNAFVRSFTSPAGSIGAPTTIVTPRR